MAGARVRSRIGWHGRGERSAGFFVRMERQRQKDSTIAEICHDGRRCTSVGDMLEAGATFYERLYDASTTSSDCADRLLSCLDRSLTYEGRVSLDSPLDPGELRAAAAEMANNKSPGVDGLPIEFYCHFWALLEDDLMAVYDECLSIGSLSLTQTTGIVRLLYKKGDRSDLRNWRPISLLTADYKILAKALVSRLSKFLPSIVHEDQSCGVPGRSIRDSNRVLQDVVDYCDAHDLPAGLVSLDQEKAFDRVDWSFLDRVLTALNIRPRFRSYVTTLYAGVSSRVLVNGWLSRRIYPKRGVRQGCPMSPVLYVLVAETLGALLRTSPIRGLALPASPDELKVVQYADDTTVVVSNEADFSSLSDCLRLYESGSGAKLNMSKSRGLFVGSWKGRVDFPLSLEWTSDHVKILGLLVGPERSLCLLNWKMAADKMRAAFRMWKPRDLSMSARSFVARAFATSSLWYVAHVVPVTLALLDEINTEVWRFIWAGHAELVSRRVCCRPVRSGGLAGVIVRDKVAALQLQWIARLFDESDSRWKCFARYWLDRAAQHFTDHRGLLAGNTSAVSSSIPWFYSNLVKTYRRYNGSADGTGPNCLSEVMVESLFGKPLIVGFDAKPFFSRSMASEGLVTIGDLRHNGAWIPITRLQRDFDVGPYFLKGFVPKLWRAIPEAWFSLPDVPPSSPCFTILSGIPLVCRGMYGHIAVARDVHPVAVQYWGEDLRCRWSSAWKGLLRASLDSAYHSDIAFKFLHRVLPTPHRLLLFLPSHDPGCPSCGHRRATIDHIFGRCPTARLLRLPLRRLLSVFLPAVPSNLTLLSAPFIPNLASSRAASFLVWLFIATYWQHYSVLSPTSILSIVASGVRRRMSADWHLARRHRPPAVEFFRSQWMPPGGASQLCFLESGSLTIRLADYFRLPSS